MGRDANRPATPHPLSSAASAVLGFLRRAGHRLCGSLESDLRVGTVAEGLLCGCTAATEHGPGLGGYDVPVGVAQFDRAGDDIWSVWPCFDCHFGRKQSSLYCDLPADIAQAVGLLKAIFQSAETRGNEIRLSAADSRR